MRINDKCNLFPQQIDMEQFWHEGYRERADLAILALSLNHARHLNKCSRFHNFTSMGIVPTLEEPDPTFPPPISEKQ